MLLRTTRCMRLASLAQIIQEASRCSAAFGTPHDTETVIGNRTSAGKRLKSQRYWFKTVK